MSYQSNLKKHGFGLEDAKTSIEIVHKIRNASPNLQNGEQHPFVSKPIIKHPFN